MVSNHISQPRNRAQESRAAIERLYIAMRHLFIRGGYKPSGLSGSALVESLMTLRPEIYGSIADPEKVELEGLLYIFQRLPLGIEAARYIKLISREGFEGANFRPLIPSRRRRLSYRVDDELMVIEMTRGRSDIYDILTHLTFMFIESNKIRRNSLDTKGIHRREWTLLEQYVQKEANGEPFNKGAAYSYLSTLLGRTYEETATACQKFDEEKDANSLFTIVYWLGRRAMEERSAGLDREITFSAALREKVGHHIYGTLWANNIKAFMKQQGLLRRPIHLISANLHSVMNLLYAPAALKTETPANRNIIELAEALSLDENSTTRLKIKAFALKNGMYELQDTSGTNISVQIFDTAAMSFESPYLSQTLENQSPENQPPVLVVMDYAFGEQAFETMDELLKPFENLSLNVFSISIMGKAGILEGKKGDIMIPNAHVFEGTADNYPFHNDLTAADFDGAGVDVFAGPMITVLGTSLQNKDILEFFHQSSWKIIGLEMEGAHFQKAIQAAALIRRYVRSDVTVRYAYYASDNPIVSGQTLASGSLGLVGVKPTYLITAKILEKIFNKPIFI